jgi:Carboxypeptidase regulatory-like domain/TonB dependent receptor
MERSTMKRHFILRFVTGLAICVLGLNGAWAQTGTTSVQGVVTDKSGAVVSGAHITLINTEQGLERSVETGSAGEFNFLALPPGVYTLSAEASGFRKYERKNLQLLVNTPATANVILEIGTSSQTVEVSASTETLNTTDASLGNAFDESQIKQLPLEGRNIPDLLSLQAGVAYTGNRPDQDLRNDTRSGAVNGARSDQSNITLDGVDVNADTKGYAFTSVLPITADSVQEFRVTTTNYNADEGRSSGAQVALVTKSGTNDFHGSAYEYHRNTVTSANDYFVKQAELTNGQPNQAPKLIRNIFGGSLGGPIIKQRLFFFANYEGARQREAQSVVRIVPSAAMRDGVITYTCADPTACPGGTVQGLTASHTIAAGNFGLSPGQIQGMDPQGIGVSTSVMIPYLNAFPLPNDPSTGDGVNYEGFRFKGPVAIDSNWYIARLDYKITSNGNHSLFWRGALRNDFNNGVPYLPGQKSLISKVDYSKGFSVGYSAVLRSNLVNNFRWGFTRESFGQIGTITAPYIQFRGLNDNSTTNNSSYAFTPTQNYQVPVHNFVDDISWIKGKHTLQFGGNLSFLRNPQSNNLNSFSTAVTNASWFVPSGLANQGGAFDPVVAGLPQIDPGFNNNYDYPMIALVGMVNQVNAQFNFNKNGTPLAQGTPVTRRFADDGYEMYAQDSWKVKPNLTVTYGLRYSLFSPPWETNGLQVSPNISLTDWINLRAANMAQGIGSNAAPLISFNLAGPGNGKPGFYNWDTKDFAPRFAVAYSPNASDGLLKALFGGPGKTTIRAGFGRVYDRLGPSLLATFDQDGSFGLSTTLTNAAGVVSPATAPRITGLNAIPTQGTDGTQLFASTPSATFPQTFPANGTGSFAVYWGSDNKLVTPYSYTLDFSVGREIAHNLSLEVSYVGRLSHRLLAQEDVATPENLVDPKTKVDYFTAATALAKLYRQGIPTSSITPQMVGPTAAYWGDILQPLQPGGAYSLIKSGGSTTSPLQAAYDLLSAFSGNETTAIQLLDQGALTDANLSGVSYYGPGGPYAFLDGQFAALYAWRSIAKADYHALQVNLRKHMSHGLQFDVNYTFSKSMDISSDANRIPSEGGIGNGAQVINAWQPSALRAVSDFDLTHQFNANWIAELPFGKGRWIGRNSPSALDAFIGGWQLTGLARWTSGFPFGVANGAQWPTNWQQAGYATQIGPVSTHGAVKNPDGTVNIFGNATAAAAALANYQADFPGQVGARNTLRGDGFAGLDLGLAKRWKMPWKETHSLQFRWEVFNALNLTRFDVSTLNTSITNGSTFGDYSGLLTNPRTMQFALRYEF